MFYDVEDQLLSQSGVRSSEVLQVQTIFERAKRAKTGANHSKKRLVVLGENSSAANSEVNHFDRAVAASGQHLCKSQVEILQVNLGKMCNLTCDHCHVEAGPDRSEIMTASTIDYLVQIVPLLNIKTVDLTGGAPEMAPGFKEYVRRFRKQGCDIIVRSNLTILLEPGYEDFIDFFQEEKVRVVASLPCYSEENVDRQRGDGVFQGSIEVLQQLNRVGYGLEGSGLVLDLVYNPGDAVLPGPQAALEQAYKERLRLDFGIEFSSLYVITNLPIGRFYTDLKKRGLADHYDKLLRDNFNEITVPHLMCANTMNISWDGWVYDCDFNQMLELPSVVDGRPLHVCDLEKVAKLPGTVIATGNHCFGCTAGAGSSCGGELL